MHKGDEVRYVPSGCRRTRSGVIADVRSDHVLVISDGKFAAVPLYAVKEVRAKTDGEEIEEVLRDA
jgi:hypothetical protein